MLCEKYLYDAIVTDRFYVSISLVIILITAKFKKKVRKKFQIVKFYNKIPDNFEIL